MILSDGKAFKEQGYDLITDPNTGKTCAVMKSTGEVVETTTMTAPVGSYIVTPEQQEANRKRAEFLAQKERAKELGRFFFLPFSFCDADTSPIVAARLVYLATYIKFGTDSLYVTKRTPMKVEHLKRIMGMSDTTAWRFWHDISPNHVMEDERGKLHIDKGTAYKGYLSNEEDGLAYKKIYIEAVRTLYRKTLISNHKQLGFIFKMLPYINIEYNILCWNPFENDVELIEPMTLQQFCEEIGYSYSKVGRLIKVYSNITFKVSDRMEQFCTFNFNGKDFDKARIIVNPHILYSGSDYKKVEILGTFCKE